MIRSSDNRAAREPSPAGLHGPAVPADFERPAARSTSEAPLPASSGPHAAHRCGASPRHPALSSEPAQHQSVKLG